MAAQVGKFAANHLLKKQMKTYKDKKVDGGDVNTHLPPPHAHLANSDLQDPYFAMIEDPRKPGKYKKVKKQIPAYIPEHDAEVLARVRKSSYRLDMCLFNFLGIRFGWEAVIGIIPMAGDAIGVAMALMVFKKCCSVEGGLDQSIKLRMLINIIADFLVGLVPFLGDLADAAFKCNTRNLRLLEVTLDKKYKPTGRDERDLVGVDREKRRKNRASGLFRRDDPPPATVFEDFSDGEMREMQESGNAPVTQPPPAYDGTRGDSTRDPRRRNDIEMAQARQQTGSVRR